MPHEMSRAELLEAQIRTDPGMVKTYGTPEMQPTTTVGIQAEMREKKRNRLVIVYVLLIIVGLLGLSFALLDDAGIKKYRETADPAVVTVTRVAPASNEEAIYVTYEYDQTMYTNVYAGKAPKDRYSTGNEITVYVSRENPQVLMMDLLGRFLWLRNISLALLCVGVVLIIIRIFRKKLKNTRV